jgi:hypothetical protein
LKPSGVVRVFDTPEPRAKRRKNPGRGKVTGEMGVFRWLREHLDVLLLLAVITVIILAGGWVFRPTGRRDADSRPRRIKKRRDDDGWD